MKDRTLFVGMDVHKETISVSVLESRGHEARPTVTIANRPSTVRQVFEKLRKEGEVHAAYEAGCRGYVLHRDLTQLGVDCQVIAPSLIPVRPGDRVKTDRRDAEKLARLLRAGELTAIRVPTPAEESLRDLVRCREDAREDGRRDKHRVLKFLLRHGRIYDQGRHWTEAHWRWLRAQRFEQPMTHGVFLDYQRSRAEAARGGRLGTTTPAPTKPDHEGALARSARARRRARLQSARAASSPILAPDLTRETFSGRHRRRCTRTLWIRLGHRPYRCLKGEGPLSFDARSQRSTEPGRRDSRRLCVAAALSPHDPRAQTEKASRRTTDVRRRSRRPANPRVIRRRCSLGRPLTEGIE